MLRFPKAAAALAISLAAALPASARADDKPTPAHVAGPLSPATLSQLRQMYKQLIDAENAHDLDAVRPFLWDSPSALFVAKTATAAEGNWAGFWGTEVVMQHFHDLYQGSFRLEPDYSKEVVVGLTRDVAETYVPLNITVAYAGQTTVPKPFLMILEWVHTPKGWKMATDIALPIPPAPPGN